MILGQPVPGAPYARREPCCAEVTNRRQLLLPEKCVSLDQVTMHSNESAISRWASQFELHMHTLPGSPLSHFTYFHAELVRLKCSAYCLHEARLNGVNGVIVFARTNSKTSSKTEEFEYNEALGGRQSCSCQTATSSSTWMLKKTWELKDLPALRLVGSKTSLKAQHRTNRSAN